MTLKASSIKRRVDLPARRFPPPPLITFRAEGFVLIYFQRFASTDVAVEAQGKIIDADDPPGAVA
jgi:hypothetical protein